MSAHGIIFFPGSEGIHPPNFNLIWVSTFDMLCLQAHRYMRNLLMLTLICCYTTTCLTFYTECLHLKIFFRSLDASAGWDILFHPGLHSFLYGKYSHAWRLNVTTDVLLTYNDSCLNVKVSKYRGLALTGIMVHIAPTLFIAPTSVSVCSISGTNRWGKSIKSKSLNVKYETHIPSTSYYLYYC